MAAAVLYFPFFDFMKVIGDFLHPSHLNEETMLSLYSLDLPSAVVEVLISSTFGNGGLSGLVVINQNQ